MSMGQSPSLELRSDFPASEIARLNDELVALRRQHARAVHVKCPSPRSVLGLLLAGEVMFWVMLFLFATHPTWAKGAALAGCLAMIGLLLIRQRADDIAAAIADREARLAALRAAR
jgi:hypothetical protein